MPDICESGSDADNSDSEDESPHSTNPKKSISSGGARRGRGTRGDMMVRERAEDGTSVVDLLDPSMVRNMRVSSDKRGGNTKAGGRGRGGGGGMFESDNSDSEDSDGNDGPELGLRDGKFVIPGDSDNDDSDEDGGNGRRKKKRSREGVDSDDSGADDLIVDTGKNESGFVHMAGRKARAAADERSSQGAMGRPLPGGRGAGAFGRGTGGAGRGGGAAGKRQKAGGVRGTGTGAEFRSKKAGGDVKRKGATLEPYAYIPLDGRTLTGKKSGDTALKQYGAVVGTAHGAKKSYHKRRRGGNQK